MADVIGLKLEHLNELDLLDLEEQLKQAGVDPASQTSITKSHVPQGTFGVPADFSMVLQVAQFALPTAIAVLALWVSKGRSRAEGKKISFSWTTDGVNFEKVTYDQESESDTSNQIKSAIESSIASSAKLST